MITLQVLGLAVVALLAGSMWVACGPSASQQKATTAATTPQQPSGPKFTFQQQAEQRDTDCKANSYGKVTDYFDGHACQALTRWIYTTTGSDGARIVTAMSRVQMADAGSAAELKSLTDGDGTGNVGYLTHNGLPLPAGPDRFGKPAGYSSAVAGTAVLIAESASLDRDGTDIALLKEVSAEAITSAGK